MKCGVNANDVLLMMVTRNDVNDGEVGRKEQEGVLVWNKLDTAS